MNVSNCSFKSYIPVKYYAVNPKNGEYSPVTKKSNLRKCHSFVIRNLTGSAKNNKNAEFVDTFKSMDREYRNNKAARSYYDKNKALVHLLTGDDVSNVDEFAKSLGIAKGDALDRAGTTHTFEVSMTSQNVYDKVMSYISHDARPIRDENRTPLELRVFFNPKYKKNGDLKGFEYIESKFLPRSKDFDVREA
ncbi:hypothetical protein II906_05415 [bacterium]|nr:hypothetical protein [bacterium]